MARTILNLWWTRNFRKITIKEAKELKLKFSHNIHGDAINHLNCRSIWVDRKGRCYKVKTLYDDIDRIFDEIIDNEK